MGSSRRTSTGSCSSLSRSADSTTIAAATTTTTTDDYCHNKDDAQSSSSSSSSSCSSLSSSSSSSSSCTTIARVVPEQHSLRHVLGVHDSSVFVPTSGTPLAPGEGGSSPTRTLTTTAELAKEYSPWIVGHRGCLYQELENTREGFQACADMGCDAVELDVFLLPKCQTLIVFHGGDGGSSIGDGSDARPGLLHDYCGVQGSILDYTYQEALTKLRFNPSHAELA